MAAKPDVKDTKTVFLELTARNEYLEAEVKRLTVDNAALLQKVGGLTELNMAGSKRNTALENTVNNLRDACGGLDRARAETLGYARAITETVERQEGVMERYPNPMRRQIPGLGRLQNTEIDAHRTFMTSDDDSRRPTDWWRL